MILRAAVVLIALLVSSAGAAQADFQTYQSWVDLPEGQRSAYIQGVFDAMVTFWPGEDETREQLLAQHYDHCIAVAHMTDRQLAANVMSYTSDKLWMQVLAVPYALRSYLIAACGAPPTK